MSDYAAERTVRAIGIDISDRQSAICEIDEAGRLTRGRCQTTPNGIQRRFSDIEPCRVALEVGSHSPWVSELLEELGHEVIVANPAQVALIARSQRKSDAIDAELLARLARLDPKLLFPLKHRGPQAREHLALLRTRSLLMRTRGQLVVHIRGSVKPLGERIQRCSVSAFPKRARACLSEGVARIYSGALAIIEHLTAQIQEIDRVVTQLCEETYPETKVLRQITGVGPLVSLCYVLTIEDPTRFAKSRQVGAYSGLTPRLDESGDLVRSTRISKNGDAELRRMLVQSAHYILSRRAPDSDLKRWGERKLAQSGRRRAVVAMARKLAVLMHRLWITEGRYEPLRQAEAAA